MDLIGSLKLAARVRARHRKSMLGQLYDIVRLRLSRGKLGASEYYAFGLFDDQRYRFEDKKRFLGYRSEDAIDARFNNREWHAVSNDKLIFYSTLRAHGHPHPRIVAVLDPLGRSLAGSTVLDSEQDAADFLRSTDDYPMFIKPIHGAFGRGAASLLGYDRDSDSVRLGDGESVKVNDLFGDSTYTMDGGYLFQELLMPHPETVPVFGDRLSGLRVIVMLADSGPEVVRVVWKIPVGTNMSDNFVHGSSGNLLASVDPSSGAVSRVVSGVGLALSEIKEHPDTGVSLDGLVVPQWDDVVDLCTRASRHYPGLRLQHWDISVATTGPVPLEANIHGDMDLPQFADGRGMGEDILFAES